MLQIKDICKQYKTGSLVQKALDHVSLNLRDNEFVAILGPSGSGKTTLLNIIGGLDRYDSGDLIINGVSTKKYKDRDWDSYRNHAIGFVFQSYNLIPHQTVLSNVELALTIGGISRKERRKRAVEALEKVGLGDQIHKKPGQMSGGQMQRVAIARALVNDPDILLADEPTGALDSETSLQVMDLLKEVASDRLVVMVTHNPELAEQYATRVVKLKDGVIQEDSDPYVVQSGETTHRSFGKASMSFLTALSLSFNNLRTKLARTILIALAGSIGITGIALILSISNGVNTYIKSVEEDTLSEYPLTINGSTFDMAAFMGVEEETRLSEAEVVERKTLSNLLTKISANDLASLRTYLESGESQIDQYARAVEYSYGFTPEIFRLEGDAFYQTNPDTTLSDLGFGGMTSGLMGASTTNFHVLPEEAGLYINQYDVMAGHWPEKEDELLVVLSAGGRIADLTLYSLGLKDPSELSALINSYLSGGEAQIDQTVGEYRYQDFIGREYSLVQSCDYYQYDSAHKVWTNKREDRSFMRGLIENGRKLTICGVVKPKENASVSMLGAGVYYTPELMYDSIAHAADSEIVRMQLANPDTDVISNTPFGQQSEGELDLQELFSVDEEALQNAFSFDTSVLELSPEELDLSGLNVSLSPEEMGDVLSQIQFNMTPEQTGALFADLMEDYMASHMDDPASDVTQLSNAFNAYLSTPEAAAIIQRNLMEMMAGSDLQSAVQTVMQEMAQELAEGYAAYALENGLTDFSSFSDYLQTEQAQQIIAAKSSALAQQMAAIQVSPEQTAKLQQELIAGYLEYAAANQAPQPDKIQQSFTEWLQTDPVQARIAQAVADAVDTSAVPAALAGTMNRVIARMTNQMQYVLADAMSNMALSMEDALQIDGDALAKAFNITMSQTELQELMNAMMSTTAATLEGNLAKLGYIDREKPAAITLYPRDFAAKAAIKDILNAYNNQMKASGQDEKVIAYSDIVGTLMSSVTEIVNAISYVLVAFVTISLVVSSIMIGVITYISVLERRKEIGVLRAIGASKHNISQVFNAETFIIGLLAGALGIISTELLLIPGNILLHSLTGMDTINAILPMDAAAFLVVLSVILTLISGLLPAKKASRSDPVTALRTE